MSAAALRVEISTLGTALIQHIEREDAKMIDSQRISSLRGRVIEDACAVIVEGEKAYQKVRAGENVQANMDMLVNLRDGLKSSLTVMTPSGFIDECS